VEIASLFHPEWEKEALHLADVGGLIPMSASLLVWLFGTGPNETGQMSFSELAASFTAKQMWQAKMQFCW